MQQQQQQQRNTPSHLRTSDQRRMRCLCSRVAQNYDDVAHASVLELFLWGHWYDTLSQAGSGRNRAPAQLQVLKLPVLYSTGVERETEATMPWQSAPSLLIIIGAFNVAAGAVWGIQRIAYGKVRTREHERQPLIGIGGGGGRFRWSFCDVTRIYASCRFSSQHYLFAPLFSS